MRNNIPYARLTTNILLNFSIFNVKNQFDHEIWFAASSEKVGKLPRHSDHIHELQLESVSE